MIQQNFNRDWTVKSISVDEMAALDSSSGLAGNKVTLPHDALIGENRSKGSAAGNNNGYFPGQDVEYTKEFMVDASEEGRAFVLYFEGMYNRGYVYVNGALAGNVHYGYTPLIVDATPYLLYGRMNRITVKVMNSDIPNSRWYTGTGLFRPVSLYTGGAVRIPIDGVRISTPEISEKIAVVKADIQIHYDLKTGKRVRVETKILDETGMCAAEDSAFATLFPQTETVLSRRIYVPEPKLWDIETPHLYTSRVSVYDGETLLDTAENTFGIRKLELNPLEGLKLNGRRILLRGGCIHHDNGVVGAAGFSSAEERRIRLLKEAGFNSVRMAHNTASIALLDACDRLGMLVMDESFDMWTHAKTQFDYSLDFADHWEKDVEAIVAKDFNHPCVFMYSIGNEIQPLGTGEGAQWSRRLSGKFRSLDPTRYVTCAINGVIEVMDHLSKAMKDLGILEKYRKDPAGDVEIGGNINDVMSALLGEMNYLSTHPDVETRLAEVYETLDLIGLNYMRDVYEQMKLFPNRVFYGSETLPPDIDLNWKKVKNIPACIGDYTWTAWDYMGEAGIGIVTYEGDAAVGKPYPAYLAYCGDFDITGFRRPISYFREIVFGLRRKPYIAVQLPCHYRDTPRHTPWVTPTCVSSWTWNGFEGQLCKVDIYSDAPEVELFVNGKSQGKLPTGEEHRFTAVYDVIYEPGMIKAVAYYADAHTEEYVLATAGKATAIDVTVDKDTLEPDDIAYVEIMLRDENGELQTSEDQKVRVTVEGDGCLQGFGSADPWSEESLQDSERTTYFGRALAVVRAGNTSGAFTVTVEADGLPSVSKTIQVKD